MWFWLIVLHHQLPLYTAGMGTYPERSVPGWACSYQEGCRKPERSPVQEQVESSASGVLGLFLYIPVTRIMWLCLCFPIYKIRQYTYLFYDPCHRALERLAVREVQNPTQDWRTLNKKNPTVLFRLEATFDPK